MNTDHLCRLRCGQTHLPTLRHTILNNRLTSPFRSIFHLWNLLETIQSPNPGISPDGGLHCMDRQWLITICPMYTKAGCLWNIGHHGSGDREYCLNRPTIAMRISIGCLPPR